MTNHDPADDHFMACALDEARQGALLGEVPVGAILTLDGRILARAHNEPILRSDPSAHAEMLAIRRAAVAVGNYRLTGASLYVTLEPCIMCAGLMVQARIDRLIFGTSDPKGGAVTSLYAILDDPRLNHRVSVTGGVMQEACAELLSRFFKEKRVRADSALK